MTNKEYKNAREIAENASELDTFTKYLPWNNDARYEGALDFSYNNKNRRRLFE